MTSADAKQMPTALATESADAGNVPIAPATASATLYAPKLPLARILSAPAAANASTLLINERNNSVPQNATRLPIKPVQAGAQVTQTLLSTRNAAAMANDTRPASVASLLRLRNATEAQVPPRNTVVSTAFIVANGSKPDVLI